MRGASPRNDTLLRLVDRARDSLARVRVIEARCRDEAVRFVTFHGGARLAGIALALVAVCAGGWWLLRPPAPALETLVPVVATAGSNQTSGPSPVSVAPGGPDTGGSGAPREVRVHVAGAVKRPGVYSLSADARIIDALRAAGGSTQTADLERINLAQSILDAEQIFVPRRGASRTATTVAPRHRPRRTRPTASTPGSVPGVPVVVAPGSSQPSPASSAAPVTPARMVNLNTATTEELDTLPGVGPATARAIVSYRTRRGPFAKVEDLLNIDGIGPKKLESLRAHVVL